MSVYMGLARYLNDRILAKLNLRVVRVPETSRPSLNEVDKLARELEKQKKSIARLSLRLEALERALSKHGLDRLLPTVAILSHPVDPRPLAERKSIPRIAEPLFFRSSVCTAPDFRHPEFQHWCARFGERLRMARKLWEFVFIAAHLEAAGVLAPGHRGLGFGVGQEPLPAAFAGRGAKIVATDQAPETAGGWQTSGQHAASRDILNKAGLCPQEAFEERVSFEVCDMRNVSAHYRNFDFCWSACCLEHLGSIKKGLDFIRESIKTLKPGGVAVHTTEYNISSNDDTIDNNPSLVLYRRRDLDQFVDELRAEGHHVSDLNYNVLQDPLDIHVDVQPFSNEYHLRLLRQGFVFTSIGIVIQRGAGQAID